MTENDLISASNILESLNEFTEKDANDVFNWHWYPKESPPNDGMYLVKYLLGDMPCLASREYKNGKFITYGWEVIKKWAE